MTNALLSKVNRLGMLASLSLALGTETAVQIGGGLTAINDPKRVVNFVPMQLSKMLSIWRPAVLDQGGVEMGKAR